MSSTIPVIAAASFGRSAESFGIGGAVAGPLVVAPASPITDFIETRGRSFLAERTETVLVELDTAQLRNEIERVTRLVSGILADHTDGPTFRLKEASVSLEISAEGGVSLIGTLTAGAKGAVTLTFERK